MCLEGCVCYQGFCEDDDSFSWGKGHIAKAQLQSQSILERMPSDSDRKIPQ
jgi:hypothetical protein